MASPFSRQSIIDLNKMNKKNALGSYVAVSEKRFQKYTTSALEAFSQLKNALCLLNRLVSSSNHGDGYCLGWYEKLGLGKNGAVCSSNRIWVCSARVLRAGRVSARAPSPAVLRSRSLTAPREWTQGSLGEKKQQTEQL